ncbi:DUF4363 family protein [Acetivibrio clariflavus]|uniref:DUF4363 domain-containing protein n=1 Tax=Acetivibrio clariflavus (strain DSM 19732 / NBRC 101661 / EBR45) TaxID=720554 RepID=G8M2Z7_ACECE|nr:DUF4363 family protein [Acetivibrio clariflavus]AEV69306.1 hypothetical protein Clocl_2752 [Acetivibrio clariflavus DSM 19732]
MTKKIINIVIIIGLLINISSCALFHKPIDERTGFSGYLKQTEEYIKSEDWEKAKLSLEDSKKIWEKLKPLLQIDIDHDYVNSMEEYLEKLGGYIEGKDKGNSLASILTVEDIWKKIGSM